LKLHQTINAVPALNKLGNSDLPLFYAYKLRKILTELQPDIDFFNEHNMKIIEKYNGKIKENGKIEYPDESRAAAQEEFNALLSFDTQAEIMELKIPIGENIKISANDIGVLSPFVKFIEIEIGGNTSGNIESKI